MGSYFSNILKKENIRNITNSLFKSRKTEKIKNLSKRILEDKKFEIEEIENEIILLNTRLERSILRKKNKLLLENKLSSVYNQIQELLLRFNEYNTLVNNNKSKYNDIFDSVKKIDSKLENLFTRANDLKDEYKITIKSKKIKKIKKDKLAKQLEF